MTLAAATFAIVIAILLDFFGWGPSWISDRVAAVLALFALTVFIDSGPIGAWLLDAGNAIADWLGDFLGQFFGSAVGTAIATYGLPIAVAFTMAAWIGRMLPGQSSRWFGSAATKQMTSFWIWGGAAVIVIGGALVPGVLGEVLRAITSLGVTAGQEIAGAAV